MLPTKGNLPQQQRTGNNQGPQPPFALTNTRFIGQPAIKATGKDTVIFRNSPVVPGESNPRAVAMNPGFVSGAIYNLTGGEITIDLILIDDKGNEYNLTLGNYGPIADQSKVDILGPAPLFGWAAFTGGFIVLLPGWSLILRVLTGAPTAGRGVVIWPWVHDLSRNVVPVIAELTTAVQAFGPPKGRGWQLMGSKANEGESQLAYLNFDDISRTVSAEYLHLAGEDIQISSGISVTPRENALDSGIAQGFMVTEDGTKSLILAYPDKIKVKAGEGNSKAPLYMFANFAEFDLPRDMG